MQLTNIPQSINSHIQVHTSKERDEIHELLISSCNGEWLKFAVYQQTYSPSPFPPSLPPASLSPPSLSLSIRIPWLPITMTEMQRTTCTCIRSKFILHSRMHPIHYHIHTARLLEWVKNKIWHPKLMEDKQLLKVTRQTMISHKDRHTPKCNMWWQKRKRVSRKEDKRKRERDYQEEKR